EVVRNARVVRQLDGRDAGARGVDHRLHVFRLHHATPRCAAAGPISRSSIACWRGSWRARLFSAVTKKIEVPGVCFGGLILISEPTSIPSPLASGLSENTTV